MFNHLLPFSHINQERKLREMSNVKAIDANVILRRFDPTPTIHSLTQPEQEHAATLFGKDAQIKTILDDDTREIHLVLKDDKPVGKIRYETSLVFDQIDIFYEDDYENLLRQELLEHRETLPPGITAVIENHLDVLTDLRITKRIKRDIDKRVAQITAQENPTP